MAGTSRDPRLVAVHRGGSLKPVDHRLLASWAADCAERVLPLFESASPGDSRPDDAVTAARAWAAGEVAAGEARRMAVAAHAAARASSGSAQLTARACGHAAATAHMADHALGAAYYALRALEASGRSATEVDAEREWQVHALPDPIADLVRADMAARAAKFQRVFDGLSGT